jgi:hypothetical protein
MKDVAARGWNILILSFHKQEDKLLERHAKCKAVYCMLLTNIKS